MLRGLLLLHKHQGSAWIDDIVGGLIDNMHVVVVGDVNLLLGCLLHQVQKQLLI